MTTSPSGFDWKALCMNISQFGNPCLDATNIDARLNEYVAHDRMSFSPNDYVRLRRQRAWALFLDRRPRGPGVPTLDAFETMFGSGSWTSMADSSGIYSDPLRDEFIAHGKGVMTYDVVRGALRKPFWQSLAKLNE